MRSFLPIHGAAYVYRRFLRKYSAKLAAPAVLGVAMLALATLAGCGSSANQDDLTVHVATPTPGGENDRLRDTQTDDFYSAAKLHDVARLDGLRKQAELTGKPLDPALALALYIVDSRQYASDFVAGYPTNHLAVQFDYGPRLDRANVVPGGYLFPIHAIGRIAASGDTSAMSKLLLASSVADGRIADAYAEEVVHAANLAPASALAALAALPPATQLSVSSFPGWCTVRVRMLDQSVGTVAEQHAQVELRARLLDCPTSSPRARHAGSHGK